MMKMTCIFLTLAISLAMLMFANFGCSRKSEKDEKDKKDVKVTIGKVDDFSEFEACLKQSITDDQKWDVVVEDTKRRTGLRSSSDCSMDKLFRDNIICPLRRTEIILTHYPNFLKRLNWEVEDLQLIGNGLGTTGRYYPSASSLHSGQVSDILLEKLTGKKFKDRETFDKWFIANKSTLKWNKELGRFETAGGW